MIQIDMDSIAHLAKKVVQQIRHKSKSIKKETNNSPMQLAAKTASISDCSSLLQDSHTISTNASQSSSLSISSSQCGASQMMMIYKRTKFTAQEDEVILKYVASNGKKWAEIAKRLPGRTEVMVRNRYYVKIRKMAKEAEISQSCHADSSQDLGEYSQQPQQVLQLNEQRPAQSGPEPIDTFLNQEEVAFEQQQQHQQLFSHFDDEFCTRPFDTESMFQQNFPMQMNGEFEEHEINHIHSQIKYEHEEHLNNNHQSYLFDSNHRQEVNHISYTNEKAGLLSNQQFTALPFDNCDFLNSDQPHQGFYASAAGAGVASANVAAQDNIQPFASVNQLLFQNEQEDDDDFFEEAGKPFKIPTFEMPQIQQQSPVLGVETAVLSDATKHEKISFLQNQISMIEKMLNMCKDEIIREFAQRQTSAEGVVDTTETSAAATFQVPNQQIQEQQSELPVAQIEANEEDMSMDIEQAIAQDRALFDEEQGILSEAQQLQQGQYFPTYTPSHVNHFQY